MKKTPCDRLKISLLVKLAPEFFLWGFFVRLCFNDSRGYVFPEMPSRGFFIERKVASVNLVSG